MQKIIIPIDTSKPIMIKSPRLMKERKQGYPIKTEYPRKEFPQMPADALSQGKSNQVRLDGDVAMRTRGVYEFNLGEELIKSLTLGAPTIKYLYVGRNDREIIEQYLIEQTERGLEMKKATVRKAGERVEFMERTWLIGATEVEMFDRQSIKMQNRNDEFYRVDTFSPHSGRPLTEDIDIGEDFRKLKSEAIEAK
jgi:hypothetical protein